MVGSNEGRPRFEEVGDRLEIALGESRELAAGLGFDAFVDAFGLEQVAGVDLDEQTAAIRGFGSRRMKPPFSIELAKRGLDVPAVDISKTMVEIARKNAADENVSAVFMNGNAAELPVRKESVDFVVCRAAFKNFTEPVKAMSEMLRVLRPGGTAMLIDLRIDAGRDSADGEGSGMEGDAD